MHYNALRFQPHAIVQSDGPKHLGVIVLTTVNTHAIEVTVY